MTVFSRLTERIVRLCGDDYDKKKKYLEEVAGDKLTGNLCLILNENIENFAPVNMSQSENILRTLNRLCYYSTKLCLDAFNIGMINIIDRIFNVLDNNPRKDVQLSMLAYETISLINSILAVKASPTPLMYAYYLIVPADLTYFPFSAKIAKYIGIKLIENTRLTERLNLFKVHDL